MSDRPLINRKTVDPALLILYCGLIFTLSAQSAIPAPLLFPFQDKVIHALAYAVMGGLCCRTFSRFISAPGHKALVCLGFCSLYGLSDEFHQSFVPGRHADVFDWVADTFGATAGILLSTMNDRNAA